MATTPSSGPMEEGAIDRLVEQAGDAGQSIWLLIDRAGSGDDDVLVPCEVAEVIAALAVMVESLPQLLGRLATWAQEEQHAGRLRVDALAELPDPGQTVHALSYALHDASHHVGAAAGQLHTAHEHAAHLAPLG